MARKEFELKTTPLPNGKEQVIPKDSVMQFDGEKLIHNPTLQMDAKGMGFSPQKKSKIKAILRELGVNL